MKKFHLPRVTPSMVVACLALLVALAGTGVAAVSVALPRNSVGNTQIQNNAVTSAKVKNASLLRADFKAGQIPARCGWSGRSGRCGRPCGCCRSRRCSRPRCKVGTREVGRHDRRPVGRDHPDLETGRRNLRPRLRRGRHRSPRRRVGGSRQRHGVPGRGDCRARAVVPPRALSARAGTTPATCSSPPRIRPGRQHRITRSTSRSSSDFRFRTTCGPRPETTSDRGAPFSDGCELELGEPGGESTAERGPLVVRDLDRPSGALRETRRDAGQPVGGERQEQDPMRTGVTGEDTDRPARLEAQRRLHSSAQARAWVVEEHPLSSAARLRH